MTKAFANVKKANGRIEEVEAVAIVVRESGRMIALYYDRNCGFSPLSIKGMQRDDNNNVKIIFLSSKYDDISPHDFTHHYRWREIHELKYRIEEENNLSALSSMKGEEAI